MSARQHQAERLIQAQDTLGESPLWSVRDQALFWVDIRRQILHRWSCEDGSVTDRFMPDLCCGVVLASTGVFLALGRRVFHFEIEEDRLAQLIELESGRMQNRLNEMKADRQGRLWSGTMRDFGAEIDGALYLIGAKGERPPEPAITQVRIPNSLAWSPDDRTLFFADTAEGAIRAYDFDPASGRLGARRNLVDPGVLPGRPDGAAVDSEGGLWSARNGANCVIRVSPAGRTTDVVRLPCGVHPTSCALGGPRLDILLITTAKQGLSPEQLAVCPEAGDVFAHNVAVAGLPEPAAVHDRTLPNAAGTLSREEALRQPKAKPA